MFGWNVTEPMNTCIWYIRISNQEQVICFYWQYKLNFLENSVLELKYEANIEIADCMQQQS